MPTLPDSGVSFTVQTNGQTLIVAAGPSASALTAPLYSDAAVSSAVTLPHTITSNTTYYLPLSWANVPLYISVKQPDGTELWGKTQLVGGVTIAPLPSAAQVGADVVRYSRFALSPSVAIAETAPRSGLSLANASVLSTGRMSMVGIELPVGVTITSISFFAGTTPAGAPTNQWFALYSSARALLGQTTDDTTTAWSASTFKTLSLVTPYVTTSSGLYYLGINVTATTPPSLNSVISLSTVAALVPVLTGTSTSSLTDTAPATAGAISAANSAPYAYVS